MASANDIHREFVNAWNNRDFDKFRAMLHPEYTYTADGKTTAGPDAGVAAAKALISAFPNAQTTIRDLHGVGDTSVGEFLTQGTQTGALMSIPATGKPVAVHRCNIIQIRDEKIWREREYMDMASVLVQLGVMQAPGTNAQPAGGGA